VTASILTNVVRLDPQTVRLTISGSEQALTICGAASPFSCAGRTDALAVIEASGSLDLAAPEGAGRASFILEGDGVSYFVGERHLAFDQIVNCRDLGGYVAGDGRRVKWGHLFRSADLSDASDRDLATLGRLGLGLVCDFRTADEARKEPDRLPQGLDAYVNLPLGQSALSPEDAAAIRSGSSTWFENGGMTRIYLGWIEPCAPLWAELIDRLSQNDGHAVLFHCMAGKDRTGVFAALLLSVLGVSDADIIADHQHSNAAMRQLRAAADMHRQRAGDKAEMVLPGLPASASALRAFLDAIRAEHGTVERYLELRGGLKPNVIVSLRSILLE
jgi:protein-tyrosine phosphatase